MSKSPSSRGLSVRSKLVALAVGTALLSLLLACGSFVYYDRVSYAEAKRSTLSVLADSVSQSAFGPTAFQDKDSANVILKVLEAEPSAEAGVIYDQDGNLLAGWSRKGARVRLPSKYARSLKDGFQAGQLYVTRKIGNSEQTVGTLRVAFSTHDMRERTERFLQIAGAVLLVSALLALLLSMLAQRVITRPVALLSDAARRVQEHQDFDVRAERVSHDELGDLTDAFNAMLAMIKARDEELRHHRANLEETVRERTHDLDQRNQEMRLVLDNVDQGLIIVDREGQVRPERSAVLDRWFGAPAENVQLGTYLEPHAPGFAGRFAMGWGQLIDGFLPIELNLAQLPSELHDDQGHYYELAYRPIGLSGDNFEKLLVIVSDVSTRIAKEKSDAEQAQIIAMFEHVSGDRNGFMDFFEETEGMLTRLSSSTPRDRVVEMREVHTLKGNFGLFGLRLLSKLVHRIEDECLENDSSLEERQRSELRVAWERVASRARSLLGDGAMSMSVSRRDVEELLAAIRANRTHDELSLMTTRLLLDPVAPKLIRMGERARSLAERLGKGPVRIDVVADGVRAPGDIGWLWHVLPHVVANSVDHGLDTQDERVAAGKSGPATLRLVARERERMLVVEIEDDGRGIDWALVRKKALRLGIPANTEEELARALFADGVSTKEQASEVSGRGVGLAAVESACNEHGAKIRISTEPGKGTVFEFTLAQTNRSRPSVPLQRRSFVA